MLPPCPSLCSGTARAVRYYRFTLQRHGASRPVLPWENRAARATPLKRCPQIVANSAAARVTNNPGTGNSPSWRPTTPPRVSGQAEHFVLSSAGRGSHPLLRSAPFTAKQPPSTPHHPVQTAVQASRTCKPTAPHEQQKEQRKDMQCAISLKTPLSLQMHHPQACRPR